MKIYLKKSFKSLKKKEKKNNNNREYGNMRNR